MKIACSTRALDVYPHRYGEPLPADVRGSVFRWAAAKGFDGVEMEDKWALVEEMDEPALIALREQAALFGVTLLMKLHFRDVATESIASNNEAGIRRNIDCAAILGVPMLSFSLPTPEGVRKEVSANLGRDWRPSSADALPGAYETTIAAVRRLGVYAGERGVDLTIEMHQGSIADTSDTLIRVLEGVNLPNVGANPDLSNLMQMNPSPDEDWRACLARIAKWTNYWHVKNIRKYQVGSGSLMLRRRLDEGFVDYRWCVAALIEAGFKGFAVIEGPGFGDHLTVSEEGKNYLRRLIDEHHKFGI